MRLIFIILFFMWAGTAEAALAVDGSNTTANTCTTSISTTLTNDIVLYFCNGSTNNPITAVSDVAGLTWHHQIGPITQTGIAGAVLVFDLWWAYSPAVLTSDTITGTGNTSNGRAMVMGVNGANQVSPFDVNTTNNATLTGGSSTTSLSITNSTTLPNTMLIGWVRTDVSGGTGLGGLSAPSGFSSVISGGTYTALYSKTISASQSSVAEAFSWTNANPAIMCLVAIQAASFKPQPPSVLFISAP